MLLIAVAAIIMAGNGFQALPQSAPNAAGMEFVRIAPGEFMMGCSTGDDQCEADEKPRHRVVISRGFEVGRFEVTQGQWLNVMGSNPSSIPGDRRPVETVSKLEAHDFIARLNAAKDGYLYRLPTEAEWEYAARAGSDLPYSEPLHEVAWYAANSEDETHPVGLKKPNGWGLHDVHGNVREWVSDFYSERYYAESPTSDPTGPATSTFTGQPSLTPRGGTVRPAGSSDYPLPVERQYSPQEINAAPQQFGLGAAILLGALSPRQGGNLGPPVAGPAVEVSPGVLVDPIDGLPTGLPIVRGGGWDQSARFQRVSARYSYYGPTWRLSDIGFRVVRQAISQ
jgi:formylglycine-generating enzyme required for sulfatase activity